MIISLRQGLGRLLRTSSDKGLLAIMDNRVIGSSYGQAVLKALPPSPLTSDIKEVARFLKGL
jgi:ATP-dependent DNA helicase DinG